MIFFDASALAKRYFLESGTGRVNELWAGEELVSSLTILQSELISVLNQKRRESVLPRGAFQTVKKQIRDDVRSIPATPVSLDLVDESTRLLDEYPIRTLDALYLAGALVLQQALKEPVTFVSVDRQVLNTAQAEGLIPLNPEASPRGAAKPTSREQGKSRR